LLVIKVEPNGAWTEIYYGPFSAVKALARYSARDTKHMVAVRHLVGLVAAVSEVPLPGVASCKLDQSPD